LESSYKGKKEEGRKKKNGHTARSNLSRELLTRVIMNGKGKEEKGAYCQSGSGENSRFGLTAYFTRVANGGEKSWNRLLGSFFSSWGI